MESFYCIEVNIEEIRAGDTILHNEKLTTVCDYDIKYCSFMGISIFGDTYTMGRKKVTKCIYTNKEDFDMCRNCYFKQYLEDDIIFCNNIKSEYYDKNVSFNFKCDKYKQG